MSQTHALNFINPKYRKGLNTTTRLGDLWAEKASIGDSVQVTSNDYRRRHQCGEIVGFFLGPFNLIPEGFISMQHSPDTQNRYSLAEVMRQSYGADFHETSICTVIVFNMPMDV